jgi:hypothetical protein
MKSCVTRPGPCNPWACCANGMKPGFASQPQEDAFAPPPEEKDVVNKPEHYMRFKIEPIRFCTENDLGFLEGNIVKYTARHDAKGGKEDLKKAIRYAVMLIKQRYNGDADFWKTDDALAGYLATL